MISNQSEQPSSEDWSSTPSPLDAPPPHEADEGAGGEEMIVEQMLKLSRETGLRVQGTIKTAEGNEHAAFRSRLCAPPVGRQRLPSPRDNFDRETDKGLQDQVAVGCVTSAAASLFKGSGGEGGGSEGMLKADAAGGDSDTFAMAPSTWSQRLVFRDDCFLCQTLPAVMQRACPPLQARVRCTQASCPLIRRI